uniref:Uncharacterized protein n=1 Tax=Sphaerodactylus townsendi TaxID=933632 RepID=A0ACB8FTB0_9SAUR
MRVSSHQWQEEFWNGTCYPFQGFLHKRQGAQLNLRKGGRRPCQNPSHSSDEKKPPWNGIEGSLEESSHEPEPELESDSKTEELKSEVEEKNMEELEEKSPSPSPVETVSLPQEPPKAFSWASVTSKNLPPSGTVSSSGIPPHVKAPGSQLHKCSYAGMFIDTEFLSKKQKQRVGISPVL